MPTVSVPQANPNDELTADLINRGSNALATVVNGNLDSDNIASLSGAKLNSGTIPASAMTTDANPETRMAESLADFIASGCLWSGLTGLSAAMTSGVAYITGKRITVPAVTSYTFTATRDTYVYIDNTGTAQYVAVTVGATQPATPTNNQLVAKVVTGASTITAIFDVRVTSPQDAWRSWSPTFYNGITVGNSTVTAKFKQVGKIVFVRLKFVMGSTGAVANQPLFTLPVTAHSDYGVGNGNYALSPLYVEDFGSYSAHGYSKLNSTTLVELGLTRTDGVVSTTTSLSAVFTWGVNDYFIANFCYEAA